MILAIETSSPRASLAVLDPAVGEIVWADSFTTQRAHNAVIFGPVTKMLGQYREQLTGIVVGTGPGSYSGVRVGIAVANGLSLSLGIPAIGRSSLETWDVMMDSYAVISDARRKSFALSLVKDRVLETEPELIDAVDIGERIDRLEKSETSLFTSDVTVTALSPLITIAHPNASRLAISAGRLPEEIWLSEDSLEPIYLRPPFITQPKKGL